MGGFELNVCVEFRGVDKLMTSYFDSSKFESRAFRSILFHPWRSWRSCGPCKERTVVLPDCVVAGDGRLRGSWQLGCSNKVSAVEK